MAKKTNRTDFQIKPLHIKKKSFSLDWGGLIVPASTKWEIVVLLLARAIAPMVYQELKSTSEQRGPNHSITDHANLHDPAFPIVGSNATNVASGPVVTFLGPSNDFPLIVADTTPTLGFHLPGA